MSAENATLELTKALINRCSITPTDAGCQNLMTERLAAVDFAIQSLAFGDVENFWACRGDKAPLVTFVGHTDVVPPGPLDEWIFDPFTATEDAGYLYGRGAVDMKASLAAMVVACERFVKDYPHHPGSISLLITSDEEGPSINGTVKVVEYLQQQNTHIDYCIVGEPSSKAQLGDTIKTGRRGSLNGLLTIYGQQGHIAYPHLSINPIHKAIAALQSLCATTWDEGNEHFQPTCFQISNFDSGTGATNIIPAKAQIKFNFRFCPESPAVSLKQRVIDILEQHALHYEIEWAQSGDVFYTAQGKLVRAVQAAIESTVGISPKLSTDGGTSDGRFIAPMGSEVVEIGPINSTIHRINECVAIADLEPLTQIYYQSLVNLLLDNP